MEITSVTDLNSRKTRFKKEGILIPQILKHYRFSLVDRTYFWFTNIYGLRETDCFPKLIIIASSDIYSWKRKN